MNLAYRTGITVTEPQTFAADDVAAGGQTPAANVIHDQFNTAKDLDGGTVPPVSAHSGKIYALIAGALTIDLTALIGLNSVAVNGTGLKVRAVKIKGQSGAAPITITPGGANPYNLFGATFKSIVSSDQEIVAYLGDSAPVIGAGAKNISLAGTGTDKIAIAFVMG